MLMSDGQLKRCDRCNGEYGEFIIAPMWFGEGGPHLEGRPLILCAKCLATKVETWSRVASIVAEPIVH